MKAAAHRFWTGSIRRQLMLGIALVHAVLMTLFVFDLVGRQRTFLETQAYDQTHSLTRTLAANATPWVLANDLVGLEEVLKTLAGYPELRYAMVLSPEGRVLAHSRPGVAGRYIADAVSLRLLTAPPLPQVLVRSPRVIDVAAPILRDEQAIGWARIGLSQETSRQELGLVTREGLLYTLAAILIGILFAFLMARGLTSGLYALKVVAEAFAKGGRDLRAPAKRSDEIGHLAIGFNRMLDAVTENERDLRHALDALNKSNAELERFAYVASHDLQEPARTLVTYSQLLERRLADRLDPDDHENLSFIINAAKRMQALVRDLLGYSQMGHRQGPAEPVDTGEVLAAALANLDALLAERKAEITAPGLPRVSGDTVQLVQLFQNLIANGIKFTPRGTRPAITIAARREGAFWEFSVHDNGIGIDSRYHDQIFIIFKRLHTADQFPGTGIGLALCKRIVELHGGRIWVRSELGEGATFFFTLPAA